METKIRLSLTIPLLLTQVTLRLRLLRKTNVMKVIEEAIQPLKLILLRFLRKTKSKIKPRP